jgi:hypothetical protein
MSHEEIREDDPAADGTVEAPSQVAHRLAKDPEPATGDSRTSSNAKNGCAGPTDSSRQSDAVPQKPALAAKKQKQPSRQVVSSK